MSRSGDGWHGQRYSDARALVRKEQHGHASTPAHATQFQRSVMQTKQQIQSLLAQAGLSPRHRFGQNFMIDQNLLRIVADAGNPGADDTIIEVGPGTGTLTEELLARGAKVVAVEIDRDLAALLRERFRDESRFSLIEGDALD